MLWYSDDVRGHIVYTIRLGNSFKAGQFFSELRSLPNLLCGSGVKKHSNSTWQVDTHMVLLKTKHVNVYNPFKA